MMGRNALNVKTSAQFVKVLNVLNVLQVFISQIILV